MKNLFLLFIAIVFTSSLTFGQDCPEPVKKKYVKVTSIDFAKEYEDCPVIIEAEFFRVGYLPGFKKPNKLRKMFYFQCVEKGEEGRPKGLTKVISGEFFVIEKEKADLIFDLKKGDNIEIIGTTFTQNYFGVKTASFFKVSDVKKLKSK